MNGDRNLLGCLGKGFSWSRLKRAILVDNTPNREFTLEAQIEEAKRIWLIAQEQIHWADRDMLEAAILYTTACEKRYIGLLQKAKEQGFTTWEPTKLIRVAASNS